MSFEFLVKTLICEERQMLNGDERLNLHITASSQGDELTFTLPDNVSRDAEKLRYCLDVKLWSHCCSSLRPNVVAVPTKLAW